MTSPKQITHTVFFRLKLDVATLEGQAFYAETMKLADIPVVKAFKWVEEVSDSNSFQYGLHMCFDELADFDAYNKHPDHVRYVNEVWLPNVSEFQVLDYV